MRWSAYGKIVTKNALPLHTQGGSRVREFRSHGSVRGALSNERPYRDLRNVAANYPFEISRGFPGSEPNSGHGDHSRLSCGVGIRSSGLGSAGIGPQAVPCMGLFESSSALEPLRRVNAAGEHLLDLINEVL